MGRLRAQRSFSRIDHKQSDSKIHVDEQSTNSHSAVSRSWLVIEPHQSQRIVLKMQ